VTPVVTLPFVMRTRYLLLVALLACQKSTPSAPAPEGNPAPAEAPSRSEQTKLNAAIECLNRHSGRVFEVRHAYLDSVDPQTGAPASGQPATMGLYGPEPCRGSVQAAGALTPTMPKLDKASADYVAAHASLTTAWEALTGYYQKGETDTNRRAELHTKAVAAFQSFRDAHRALDGEVRTLNRARRVASLAAREKAEGRKLEVIIDSMMLEAETLVELGQHGDDAAALEAQIALYAKLVDEVDAYAAAHADEASKRGSIANLRNYMKTFLGASRKLAAAKPGDAERADPLAQYNYLVDNYNNH
jgi:hypothetical protein